MFESATMLNNETGARVIQPSIGFTDWCEDEAVMGAVHRSLPSRSNAASPTLHTGATPSTTAAHPLEKLELVKPTFVSVEKCT
jgi:hypothetical protein